jgi:hypothetical protein
MTNDEMQKSMAFIVDQQAQASAKIDALADAQKTAEERWTRTEEGIRALLSIAEIHEREIASLGQSVAAVSDNSRKTDERIAALSENGRATDERLNRLINVVERQLSEGRNGKP